MSRALATANVMPREATFQVLTARASVDSRGRVVRGEVSLRVQRPASLAGLPPEERVGWVNADGRHPLMALVPLAVESASTRLLYMDMFPVTWDAWLREMEDSLPESVDGLCPITGIGLDQAQTYAAAVGKRLPTMVEFSAAWGEERYPWGHRRAPQLGRVGRPRFDHLPSVGLLPPGPYGVFDLGAWLWHWVAGGVLAGGCDAMDPGFGLPSEPHREPVGFRCVAPFPS